MRENCPLCKSKNIKFELIDYQQNRYWKCNNCNFLFQNPIGKFSYQENYWTNATDPDGKKKDQTKMREFKIKNWYGDALKFVEKQKPGRIFDVGCGLGYFLSALPNTWEKHGSDVSDFAISFIQKNYPEITPEQLNLEQPPHQNQQNFDVVMCYHVIEHIENPRIFFKHLSMMVKKGGFLILGTPNAGCLTSKFFKGNFRLLGTGHLGLFDNKNLEKLFIENNFTIIKKEYPFFKTNYFKVQNLCRLFNRNNISPPFYGNIMTFYGSKDN